MDLVVGEETCEYLELCRILLASKSCEQLLEKLVDLARALHLPTDFIRKLKLNEKQNIESSGEILHQMLQNWRSIQSNKAKLSAFIAELVKLNLLDCAEDLRNYFKIQQTRDVYYSCPATGYDEFLDSKFRVLIISSMDKNVTAAKLKDTTNCVHLQGNMEFARQLSVAKATECLAIACDIEFNLLDIHPLIVSIPNTKVIVITEDTVEKAQSITSEMDHITVVRDKLKWSHLSPLGQVSLLKTSILISGKLMSFKEVAKKGDMGRSLEHNLDEKLLLDLVNDKNPNLLESGIPDPIQYYVPRRLSPRNFLRKDDIFKNRKVAEDMFLFTGMERHELSSFAYPHSTDTSSNQRRMPNPHVNYVLLEMKSDFENITKNVRVPIHLIDFKEGKFYWVKSSGNMDAIHELIETNNAQTEFSEADFSRVLQEKAEDGLPVIISDTPGMGKSQLLANFARELESRGEIVLFGVMYDLVRGLKMLQTSGMKMDDALIQQLSILGGSRLIAQTFLRDLLKSGDGNVRLNVFLDGLDEVLTSDMELALTILKCIKSITTARLWVATRTHLLKELENCLNSLGHTIHEFNSGDQVDCLVKFWKDDQTCEIRLEKFANHCLKTLSTTVRSEIAGVPLQCMLIGEIFKEEARNFANPDNLTTEVPPTIQIESITQLFQVMIEKKLKTFFERYKRLSNKASTNFYKKDLIQAHIFFSLKLLFPEINILKKKSRLQMKDIQNVGILKILSSDGIPQFIHRLFAEFFAALFLSRIFNGEKRQQEIVDADKFFSAAFATRECEEEIHFSLIIKTCKFEFNLILYFVDQLIKSTSRKVSPNINSKQFVQSCIIANFPNLFEYFDKTGIFSGQERSVFDSNLVILAARNSEVGLIARICEKYEKASGFRVRDIIIPYYPDSCTILHVVLASRAFSVVEHFVNKQGFRKILERNLKLVSDLVQECLAVSNNISEELVREKLDTLNLLFHINNEFLLDASSKIRLLGPGVHWKLICELVRYGANLMVLDSQQRSALHWWCIDSHTAEHYHELVAHIPTSLISKLLQLKEAQTGFTPLHFLVLRRDPDPRTLQLFKQLGADFNSFNLKQDSVLETAVQKHRSITTLDQLILHGANWRPKDPNDWTILHVAMGSLNIAAFKYFGEKNTDDPRMREAVSNVVHWDDLGKRELISGMGVNVNAKDKLGHTLLQRFLNSRENTKLIFMLISILEKNGALASARHAFEVLVGITKQKYDANERNTIIKIILTKWPSALAEKDKQGNTLLHYAVVDTNNKHFIDYLISRKVDTNANNNLGETPLHRIMEAKSVKTLIKHGADLTSRDNNNLTPLHRAIQRKDASIVESLLKYWKASDVHPQILVHLLYAAEAGDFSTFQVCLVYHEREQDSSVVKIKPDIVPMLHASVQNKETRIFEHLIKKIEEKHLGTIVQTIVDSINSTERNESIVDGKIKMLELVKTKNLALLNSSDSNGRIPLLLENLNINLRIWLMNNVTEPMTVDIEGRNALFYGATQHYGQGELQDFLQYLIRSEHQQQFRTQSSSLLLEIAQRKNVKVTLDILQIFGDHGADFNAVDNNGMSLLMHAVKSRWDADLLTKLVELGSDWTITNKQQSGLLHLAAEYRNIPAVELFVTKCDVNARNINLDTPLHIAIKNLPGYHAANAEVANILILGGADINAENKDGLSALNASNHLGLLHHAALMLDSGAIQFLIQQGWDVNARNRYGDMAIHYAVSGKLNREIISKIYAEVMIDIQINSRNRFLDIPRRLESWLACVNLLAEPRVNLYVKDNAGWNILQLAVFEHEDEKFQELLHYVVEKSEEQLIRKRDNRKRTLLHLAVSLAKIGTQTLDILLKYNNINDTDILGLNVLYYWMKGNSESDFVENMDILKYLLKNGADIKAKDGLGLSNLHNVVMTLKPQNWQQVLDLLIHYGADVFEKYNGGKSIVHLAAERGNPADFQNLHYLVKERGLEKLLKEKDDNGGSMLHNAACYLELNEELLSQLLRFDDINDVDNDGDSVLYWAIQGQGTAWKLQLLISNGAEWKEATNKRGDSVLHFAACWGSVEALQIFIEKGCDINARNNLKETPLHSALRGNRLRQRDQNRFNDSVHEVVEVLMKALPDLNLVDQLGHTPIVLAKEQLQLEKLEKRTVDLLADN